MAKKQRYALQLAQYGNMPLSEEQKDAEWAAIAALLAQQARSTVALYEETNRVS